MRCPFCGHEDTQVKDSRPTDDNSAIRRRRYCPSCGSRFTTFERVQLRELTVVKKNGQRVAVRPRQARALDLGRAAQAPGRSRAGRARGQRHRAPARKLRRERDPLDADRRAGDGRAARARSRWPTCASPRSIAISARPRTSRSSSPISPRPPASRTDAMMRAALALARRSLGRTWPNPAVGCVIVKDGASSAAAAPRRRPAACRGRCARPGRRRGARRHGLRHARALLALRQDAALRRCPDRGRRGEASCRRWRIPIRR